MRAGVSLELPAEARAILARGGADAAVQLREILLDHTGARSLFVAPAGHGTSTRHGSFAPTDTAATAGQESGRHVGFRNRGSHEAQPARTGTAEWRSRSRMHGRGRAAADALRRCPPRSLRRRMDVTKRPDSGPRRTARKRKSVRRSGRRLLAPDARPRRSLPSAVVYAIRGRRGVDINRRNAEALAELVGGRRIDSAIVTAALDVSGEANRATAEEIDAAREPFREHGVAIEWHDTLRAAIRAAAAQTGAGDLIVLIGAQGMNEGKRILLEEG